MLTENADCKREATGKIFPVYQNIFGVPGLPAGHQIYQTTVAKNYVVCRNTTQVVNLKIHVLQLLNVQK